MQINPDIYRGDFTIHWTGRPTLDCTSVKYQVDTQHGTFVGRASDSWLALQFAKSLGSGAEIRLHGVMVYMLGTKRESDLTRLDRIEQVILNNFDIALLKYVPVTSNMRKE